MINRGSSPRRRKSASDVPDATGEWEEEDEAGDRPAANEPGPLGPEDLVRRLVIDFRLFCKCTRPDEQIEVLGRMQQQVKSFRSLMADADLALWAKFAATVSTLLFAIAQKPGFPTFSAFRTTADALDLLRTVASSGSGWRGADPAPITVLTVADNAGRQALLQALRGQGMKVTDCDSPRAAFVSLRENPFDIIFFDTTLPEMETFVFSTKLRRLPFHATTPLILLTAAPDFATRPGSILDDACDFIAKPIVPSEAAAKAFAYGLKYRLSPEPARKAAAKPKVLPPPPAVAPAVVEDGAVTPPTAAAPAGPPAPSTKDLAEENELRRRAEEQATRLAQARAALEQELAARTAQFEQVREQAAELEKTRQALNTELGKSTRRETRLKQQCAILERQFEALNQSLGRLGEDLAQENERRLTAEQAAGRLTRQLDEVTRAESAARQQLDHQARDHAKDLTRLQSALQKEIEAREQAEEASSELSAQQGRLDKQLAAGWAQAQQALQRHAALHQAHKRIQADLRTVFDRQSKLTQQLAALDEPLTLLSETLHPPE